MIAVDGPKLAADAADGAIRSYEQIAAEIIADAGRIDAAGDEIHGDARGDELPEGLRTPNGRRAWLREAKEQLERERAENPPPVRAVFESPIPTANACLLSRGDWIRTSGLPAPNRMRYQAAPRPVTCSVVLTI